jgi:hypothetical protein
MASHSCRGPFPCASCWKHSQQLARLHLPGRPAEIRTKEVAQRAASAGVAPARAATGAAVAAVLAEAAEEERREDVAEKVGGMAGAWSASPKDSRQCCSPALQSQSRRQFGRAQTSFPGGRPVSFACTSAFRRHSTKYWCRTTSCTGLSIAWGHRCTEWGPTNTLHISETPMRHWGVGPSHSRLDRDSDTFSSAVVK